MFGTLGLPELLLIFIVALIVFGPRRLPEIGKTLGKALGEFKKATDDFKNTIEREVRVEELKQIPPTINAAFSPMQSVSRSEPAPAIAETTPHVPAIAETPHVPTETPATPQAE